MIQVSYPASVRGHLGKDPDGQGTSGPLTARRTGKRFSRILRVLDTRRIVQFAAVTLLILILFPTSKLQAQSGTINGTVVDPAGAVVPSAQVQTAAPAPQFFLHG